MNIRILQTVVTLLLSVGVEAGAGATTYVVDDTGTVQDTVESVTGGKHSCTDRGNLTGRDVTSGVCEHGSQ